MKSNEHSATVNGRGLPISNKFAVEICNYIRGKSLTVARKDLENVVSLKHAVPFRKHNKDLCHKKGVGPGRYPVKASKVFINLLDSLRANAENKGLNEEALFVSVALSNRGPSRMKTGRNRGQMKNTHVTLCAEEREVVEKKVKKKKETKKA